AGGLGRWGDARKSPPLGLFRAGRRALLVHKLQVEGVWVRKLDRRTRPSSSCLPRGTRRQLSVACPFVSPSRQSGAAHAHLVEDDRGPTLAALVLRWDVSCTTTCEPSVLVSVRLKVSC